MSFLLKETMGAFDGAQTHDWPMTSLQLDANSWLINDESAARCSSPLHHTTPLCII